MLEWLIFINNQGLCAPVGDEFQAWLQNIATVRGSSCAPVDSLEDRAALARLYNATEGGNWENSSNWLTDRPMREWYGVTNDAQGRVIGLYLNLNQLSGSIPPELGSLSNLTVLELRVNQLSGPIPSELGGLYNLERLYLDQNELSGTIPPELGGLYNLELLYLYSNRLSGTIPPELENLSKLTDLYLGFNQLSGSIPPELGSLSNLERLYLRVNQLSGSIPPELGGLSNLTRLDLSDNRLSGSIPPELGGLSNLMWLYLRGNQLSGCIPEGLQDVLGNDLDRLGLPFCGPTTVTESIAATSTMVRINSPIPVTVTFSEPVNNFSVRDISVANGSADNFVGSDGDSVYTFDVTPNAIGVVTVDIAAGVAEDSDGNGNTAAVQLTLGLPYDDDHDGAISRAEVIIAIGDYLLGGLLTRAEVIQIIGLYLFG